MRNDIGMELRPGDLVYRRPLLGHFEAVPLVYVGPARLDDGGGPAGFFRPVLATDGAEVVILREPDAHADVAGAILGAVCAALEWAHKLTSDYATLSAPPATVTSTTGPRPTA